MSKVKIWHEGDRSEALCEVCGAWRETAFEYRTVRLQKSRKAVADVLVAVCLTCDSVASIPQQSAPRLAEARKKEPARVDARIPKELRDVIGVLAAEFGGDIEMFAGGIVRYYLAELRRDPALARRVAKLAHSAEARGTPGGRLAFRTDREALAASLTAASTAAGRAHSIDRSALVRGIIVAAKQDTLDAPRASRRDAMRAIAAAVGV